MDLKQGHLFVLIIVLVIIGVIVYLAISPTSERFSRTIEPCSVYEGDIHCSVGYEPLWGGTRCSKQPPLDEEDFKAMYGNVYSAHWLEFSEEFKYELGSFCLAQAEDEQRIIVAYMQDKYEVRKSSCEYECCDDIDCREPLTYVGWERRLYICQNHTCIVKAEGLLCNYNGQCEPELGENEHRCPLECQSWEQRSS